MSTHNIPFPNIKKKITLNYHISAAKGFFLGTKIRVRNSHGKRASVFELLKFYCSKLTTQYVYSFDIFHIANLQLSKMQYPPKL